MGIKILIYLFIHSRIIIELDDMTLVKDQCRLDIRKYSFSQRNINISQEGRLHIDEKFWQWLPCSLAIWAFVLDGNLVKLLQLQ